MKFGKKYSNMTVMMAMIQGIAIGVIGIMIVGVILLSTEGRQSATEEGTEIPTGGPSEVVNDQAQNGKKVDNLKMYAKQHGVFTNSSAAETFLKSDSSLSTAAAIEIDKRYFIWSAIQPTESEIERLLDDETFKKPFLVEQKSCAALPMEIIGKVFQAEDNAEIKKLASEMNAKENQKIQEEIEAILAFTDDIALIKLHVLQYANKEDCVKISF